MLQKKSTGHYDQRTGLAHYKIEYSCPQKRWYNIFFDVLHVDEIFNCWEMFGGSTDCKACQSKYEAR